MSLFVAA